jgi:hypothetical protein
MNSSASKSSTNKWLYYTGSTFKPLNHLKPNHKTSPQDDSPTKLKPTPKNSPRTTVPRSSNSCKKFETFGANGSRSRALKKIGKGSTAKLRTNIGSCIESIRKVRRYQELHRTYKHGEIAMTVTLTNYNTGKCIGSIIQNCKTMWKRLHLLRYTSKYTSTYTSKDTFLPEQKKTPSTSVSVGCEAKLSPEKEPAEASNPPQKKSQQPPANKWGERKR